MTVQDLIEQLKGLPRDLEVILPFGSSFKKVHKADEVHDTLVVDGYEDILKKKYVVLLPKSE